ncbi:MAG: hypothetical protein GX595_20270, partial [Lentisphaerae bacterium]|nr:hypothetical protein [Lentisphaerota bacterium]
GAVAAGAAVALLLGGLTVAFIARLNRERGVAVAHAQRAEAALSRLRETAPLCAEQARFLVERGRVDEALKMLDHAIELMPDCAEYHARKGDLLQAALRLEDAETSYTRALHLDPEVPNAARSVAMGRELQSSRGADGTYPARAIEALRRGMMSQNRYQEAALLPRTREETWQDVVALYKGVLRQGGLSDDVFAYESDGIARLGLRIRDRPLYDLSILSGMPVWSLDLRGTPLSSLEPLRGMPLRELLLDQFPPAEFRCLEGLPLVRLSCAPTGIRDLSPLRGMPLKVLCLNGNPVEDLSPLLGMALEHLEIGGTGVRDLSPLRGMPLRRLTAYGLQIVDLSPLRGMPLEVLYVVHRRAEQLQVLEGMPLKELLWTDLGATDLGVLARLPQPHLERLAIGVQSRDLAALAGKRVRWIELHSDTLISIEHLPTLSPEIADLRRCTRLTDIRPLAECRELRRLFLPPHAKAVEALRALPQLEEINGRPWVDFWREVDARQLE